MNNGRRLFHPSCILLSGLLLLSWGCVHRIHVTPAPPAVSPVAVGHSLQVIVPFLALEGADHRAGITLLDWPAQDLQAAAIDYIQLHQSFARVDDKPADLVLTIKAWLTMRSRDNYRYRLRLESALGPAEKPPMKSYLVEKDAVGSSVRWVTASDQAPIEEIVQAALDDLLSQIEADYLLYQNRPR
ncbi:MAG: hypothetical protein E8D47_11685 [Nitrospira sp.]|nr:MAG: hypothetical protein E8D47_11685 [Nitrospira sp.]